MKFFSRPFELLSLRCFKRVLLTLAGVFGSLCLSILLILGTQPGTQWLFGLVHSYSDGRFAYQQLHGNLLGRIHVTELEYRDTDMQMNIRSLMLSWRPQKLLQRSLYLERLQLDGIHIEKNNQLRDEQDSVAEQDFVLSDISLPVKIILNDIKLSDIYLRTSPNEKPVLIDSLTAKADAKASTVNLSKINVKASEFEFSTDGQFKLTADYPIDINTKLQLNLKELPLMSYQGVIKGDLKKLNIRQALGGELQGDFDIMLHNPLAQLKWNGITKIKHIPMRLLDKSITEKEATFDLSLVAQGDRFKAALKPLQLNLADGEVILTGKIDLLPELNWDLVLDSRNIDPAIAYPEWPGEINLKLASKGRKKIAREKSQEKNRLKRNLDGNDFELQLILHSLHGTLRGQSLSGKGRFDVQDGLIQVQHLQLASGETNINVDGSIKQQLDLKWQLDAPKLEHWLPDMSGSLVGSGQLSGTHIHPILAGKINARQLNYEQLKLNQANLNFSLSTAENYFSHALLSIDKIWLEQNEINELLLTINGTAKTHSIEFKSRILDHQIDLKTKGEYLQSENLWRGNINQLMLKSKVLGTWQQKETAHLSIHPDKATLDRLCLFEQNSSLCSSAQWQADESQADFQIQNIALARIKPWLPDGINELSGAANLDAQITMQQALNAKLNIDLTPGNIAYLLEPDKKVRLKHQNGKIQAVLDEQEFRAKWNLTMGEHGIEGQVEIPRPALETELGNAPIKGNIKLDIKELGLLTALIHEVKDAQGFIHADLQLDGVISEPVITGVAEFVSEKISIPVMGVELSKINVKLKGHADKQVAISGQFSSGPGKIDLDGKLTLKAKQNWPAKLHLQGENFQIINLPELQAIISPDIELEHGMGGIKIKGLIDIPEAGIFPKSLPEGSKSVSEDAVVLGEEVAQPANIDLDMTVKLGENVHLKAFGLNAWLQGRMRIKKSPGQLATANGELTTTHGTYRAYGQNLTIEQGRVSYAGGYLDDPGLNIRASKEVRDTTVGVMATGTVKNLDVGTYSSDATLNSEDIVSLLLTGQKLDDANNARIYAGTELSDELSVGVNAGVGDEASEFVVRYKLRRNLHLEGLSSVEKSGGNLIYTIEIE